MAEKTLGVQIIRLIHLISRLWFVTRIPLRHTFLGEGFFLLSTVAANSVKMTKVLF